MLFAVCITWQHCIALESGHKVNNAKFSVGRQMVYASVALLCFKNIKANNNSLLTAYNSEEQVVTYKKEYTFSFAGGRIGGYFQGTKITVELWRVYFGKIKTRELVNC